MDTVNKEEKIEFPNRHDVLFAEEHGYSTNEKTRFLK